MFPSLAILVINGVSWCTINLQGEREREKKKGKSGGRKEERRMNQEKVKERRAKGKKIFMCVKHPLEIVKNYRRHSKREKQKQRRHWKI